jgi:hypothetical protein
MQESKLLVDSSMTSVHNPNTPAAQGRFLLPRVKQVINAPKEYFVTARNVLLGKYLIKV